MATEDVAVSALFNGQLFSQHPWQ